MHQCKNSNDCEKCFDRHSIYPLPPPTAKCRSASLADRNHSDYARNVICTTEPSRRLLHRKVHGLGLSLLSPMHQSISGCCRTRAGFRDGSITTDSSLLGDVRFTPGSDRTADMAGGPVRAQ